MRGVERGPGHCGAPESNVDMSNGTCSPFLRWPARALAATAITAVVGAGATSAFAAPDVATSAPGSVVSLPGGSFLWVADEQGVLHLVGDTRALAGHTVDWSKPQQLTLDQLQS